MLTHIVAGPIAKHTTLFSLIVLSKALAQSVNTTMHAATSATNVAVYLTHLS